MKMREGYEEWADEIEFELLPHQVDDILQSLSRADVGTSAETHGEIVFQLCQKALKNKDDAEADNQ